MLFSMCLLTQRKHKNQVKTTNTHIPSLALANKLIVRKIRCLTQLNAQLNPLLVFVALSF